MFAALATKIIEFAGLGDRVHVWVGDVPAVLPRVVATFGAGCVDALFIDHWKQFYLRDLHGVEAAGLLHPGSVIVCVRTAPTAVRWAPVVRHGVWY